MLHALDLPEILFRIGLYLDDKQVLACSSVCRSFHSSFSPLVWQDLHFGRSTLLTTHDTPHALFPLRRCISYNRVDIDRSSQELLDILQQKARWMRNLTFGDSDSHHHHFALGRECSRLESLTIMRPSIDDSQTGDSWHSCKTLIKQNRHSLRSLTLINWKSETTKPHLGRPLWSPLLSCSQHKNLRSLVLVKCKILGRQLDIFWTICSRLESLELDEVDMDLSFRSITTKNHSRYDQSQVRFPQLQELIIRRMRRARPLRQLELLIRPCPKLQTLCWSIDWFRPFPSNRFCNLFTSLTWPDLDSIMVSGHGSRIHEHDQTRLSGAAKRPFRLLDLGAQAVVPRPKCGT